LKSEIGINHKWKFFKTKDVTASKQEYYTLLKRSRISVSFAKQETLGFAMIESIAARCLPIVPNSLSYSELYDPVFTYSSFSEAVSLCRNMMIDAKPFTTALNSNRDRLLMNVRGAIPKMIEECREF